VKVKAQRKDKGQTRFTAYMLWAKDTRTQMITQYPNNDFGSMTKHLREMWANLPKMQKYNWTTRAKRLGKKMRKEAKIQAYYANRRLKLEQKYNIKPQPADGD
jgi:HMG (high mobility group) box